MDVHAAAASVFREESGRIVATLIRICGSFDLAEEAMQEAFAAALRSWPSSGLPKNPAAWITASAHRKLIDRSRRERTRRDHEDALRYQLDVPASLDESAWEEIPVHLSDDRLRLIFTCCHPALSREAQVALTLRTLGGLATPEIARAFLVSEATLAQRLVRARRKIQDARIPYRVPPPEMRPERLASVRAVIYLIFNEGYTATTGEALVRVDLCHEAVRLARLLVALVPGDPETLGLLALMLLHGSRREARMSDGALIPLADQDRSRWDRRDIAEGLRLLEEASALHADGPYQVQAAIAAVHARAETAGQTDWRAIEALYARLRARLDTPVVALNQAVATAMGRSLEEGLARIDALVAAGDLDHYYLLHAARADILRRLDRREDAADAYRRALDLVANDVERRFLEGRLAEVTA